MTSFATHLFDMSEPTKSYSPCKSSGLDVVARAVATADDAKRSWLHP